MSKPASQVAALHLDVGSKLDYCTMLHYSALIIALLAPLSLKMAESTASSNTLSSQQRNEYHNFSVVPNLSMNTFGFDTFCSNARDMNRTEESTFRVADCLALIAELSGPLTHYNTWFTINDLDCNESGDPWWIPVVGRLSCNFAVYMSGCPEGGIV